MSGATEFWGLVKRDAAVQAKVEDAAKMADPAQAIQAVAVDAGFNVTADDLRAALLGELSEQDLAHVAGGLSSPNEWFAEQYTVMSKFKGIG
jgi:predicted ribosomally synthesized peptide with nif11-like leader